MKSYKLYIKISHSSDKISFALMGYRTIGNNELSLNQPKKWNLMSYSSRNLQGDNLKTIESVRVV